MLKKILIGLAILILAIAALFGYAATKHEAFIVERSIVIKAPPEKIYPYLEDFHNFITWSPFEKDPDIRRVFSGAGSGEGAIYEYESSTNLGKGRIEIIDAKPSSKVVMALHFLTPMEMQNVSTYTLTPEGDMTKVTWSLTGSSPLFSRALPMFFSMDRMVGGEFEKGLMRLKTLAER